MIWGKRMLQVVWWPSPRDWALTVWRWPTGETLEDCKKTGWTNFGFWGLCLGPVEFRYWPQYRFYGTAKLGDGVIHTDTRNGS